MRIDGAIARDLARDVRSVRAYARRWIENERRSGVKPDRYCVERNESAQRKGKHMAARKKAAKKKTAKKAKRKAKKK
jgi:hypothetical protein